LQALSDPAALRKKKVKSDGTVHWTKEQVLRESSGSGTCGSYFTIGKEPPALQAVIAALRTWLTPTPTPEQCDSLFLRYGVGGVNWAHQDQGEFAWQAVLLLNPPTEYDGGALYVVDVNDVKPLQRREVPFENVGDVVIFAANSMAPSGRHFYHGMTKVTRGQRLAVGLLQKG